MLNTYVNPIAELGSITIVGHILGYKEHFIDLRFNSKNDFIDYIIVYEWEAHPDYSDYNPQVGEVLYELFSKMPNDESGREAEYKEALASENPYIRALVALNGQSLELLVKDKSSIVRGSVVQYQIELEAESKEHCDNSFLDELLTDEDAEVRALMAYVNNRSYLSKLVNDPDYRVRKAVALAGYPIHAEKLSNDVNEHVRAAVASFANEKIIKRMMFDESEVVRLSVAKNVLSGAFDIDISPLINDESVNVRMMLAGRHSYRLHFINDPDERVRETAVQAKEAIPF